jgi:hypothetical protein
MGFEVAAEVVAETVIEEGAFEWLGSILVRFVFFAVLSRALPRRPLVDIERLG